MNDEILVAYLCYLTDSNKDRRGDNFYKSLESMECLEHQKCKVVAIKNNCTSEAQAKIDSQKGIDFSITMKKNLWDLSSIYAAAKIAFDNNMKYCCYMYDDFVVYNKDFMSDCINFLDDHHDVGCLRVPIYDYDNKKKYDPSTTPKSRNPDSVRHYNTQTGKSLMWEGPFEYKSNTFYKCNWHYTSRPTIWRTDLLMSFFEDRDVIPVMQFFEGHACKLFGETGLKTGVLNGGAMHTFLESERNISDESKGVSVGVDIKDLESSIAGMCKFQ